MICVLISLTLTKAFQPVRKKLKSKTITQHLAIKNQHEVGQQKATNREFKFNLSRKRRSQYDRKAH